MCIERERMPRVTQVPHSLDTTPVLGVGVYSFAWAYGRDSAIAIVANQGLRNAFFIN